MLFTCPDLIARTTDMAMESNAIASNSKATPVATTTLAACAKENFSGGANGQALVERFQSERDGEGGGFVLRFLVADQEQSRIPYGVNVRHGTEVHLAGEAEARAMLVALRKLLNDSQ